MKTTRVVLLSILVVLAAPAAGCNDEILASDFDQTCSADTECEAVYVGDICDCGCDSVAAINKRDIPAYNEQRNDISCTRLCEPCFGFPPVACKSGTCSIQGQP